MVEFTLRHLLPKARISFIRLEDGNEIPDLANGCFNFLYGKDVFEHLVEPQKILEHILDHTAENALCFFDLNDHGERYLQHVSPNLMPLRDVVTSRGFNHAGNLRGMSRFARQ